MELSKTTKNIHFGSTQQTDNLGELTQNVYYLTL